MIDLNFTIYKHWMKVDVIFLERFVAIRLFLTALFTNISWLIYIIHLNMWKL